MSSLRNLTTGAVLAKDIDLAKTFWQRTVGLISRHRIESDEGIWIDQCSAVHTMGMRAKIDVIFLDRKGYVLKVVRAAKPGATSISCPLASAVVETGASGHLGHDLLVGDRLALE